MDPTTRITQPAVTSVLDPTHVSRDAESTNHNIQVQEAGLFGLLFWIVVVIILFVVLTDDGD